MLIDEALDFHLVSTDPTPLYMGELPWDYADVPAPVVVNLCGVFPRSAPLGTIVLAFPMHDTLDPELLPPRSHFEAFVDTVHAWAERQPTYWHCHAGINRSGMAVAAYLHRYRGLSISQAIDNLRRRRSGLVLCNNVFERTLREWYGGPHEQAFEPVGEEVWAREHTGRRGFGR